MSTRDADRLPVALAVLGAILLAVADPAHAVVQVAVEDGEIDLGAEAPSPGSRTVASSTTDRLRFNNSGSDERALWTFTASPSLVRDADGATVTGSVTFQGGTRDLENLSYGASASDGNFTPWSVVTDRDRSGELLGWTSHGDCGLVTYKGSFAIDSFNDTGEKAPEITRYYEVCDSATEIYLDEDTDFTDGDFAYRSDQATDTSTTAADYELSVRETTYVFDGADAGDNVTIRQGAYVPADLTTVDRYALQSFPDGFPAGDLEVTVEVAARNITT